MRFAAFTTVAATAGEASSGDQLMDNLRQQIALAEELGEHHFGPYGGTCPTPSSWGRTWQPGRRGSVPEGQLAYWS